MLLRSLRLPNPPPSEFRFPRCSYPTGTGRCRIPHPSILSRRNARIRSDIGEQRRSGLSDSLLRHVVDANSGFLSAAVRDGHEYLPEFRHKQRCPSAGRSNYLGDRLIAVRIQLTKDVAVTFARRDIDSSVFLVEEHVVRIG